MAFSKKNDDIKKRSKANDVFITPRDLALKHIQMIDYDDGDSWLDPCCYDPETGSYISQFPNDNKDWCEISKGVDFFEYNKVPDHICSNPPYSMMDSWLKKCIELEPKTISFLIGIGNLTAKRIEFMSKAGYELEKMNMMKVYEWFGMSVAVVFRKGCQPLFDIDRKVYRVVEKPKPKKIFAYNVKTSPQHPGRLLVEPCQECDKDIFFEVEKARTQAEFEFTVPDGLYCVECSTKMVAEHEEETGTHHRWLSRYVAASPPVWFAAPEPPESSDEEETEQCVGLYDGKCCGKKNYKKEELDLGMCKECYNKMEEDAVEPECNDGKGFCEIGEHYVKPDEMWEDFPVCMACSIGRRAGYRRIAAMFQPFKEEPEVFDNDKLKKYNN
jgi:hypothetical protein